jgi:ElaB/YqjD/DUF883 family membrane-anchored ribosome-binding protein
LGIKASAKPKEPAKDKELDDLRAKLRKLEDRLEKLDPTAGKPAQAKTGAAAPAKAKAAVKKGKAKPKRKAGRK